ncbi:MAG: spheroidene monooxygenase [Actinobacteria bacterium]|uniref:Spheroidene monooxygenase n=1 Tax=Candidatus Fonsibacter lacus TaxID=2576439 RepID=A0A965GD48_9PROT|nr:spheroidene monooxygenase [Candidatus Fonsibacter lacus]
MRITLFIWRIKTRFIPIAFLRMALDRLYLRRLAGISFYKLLGTGKGETFTPRDADLWQWGLLVVGDELAVNEVKASQIVKRWNSSSIESAIFDLETLSSHGKWAEREPFLSRHSPSEIKSEPLAIAAITRARIKWRKNLIFWRAVPPVITALDNAPGLIAAIGIGEAPIGLQGTFSIWRDGKSLRDFAYKSPAHNQAIEATKEIGWYSEELFARFSVVAVSGSINGITLNNTAD